MTNETKDTMSDLLGDAPATKPAKAKSKKDAAPAVVEKKDAVTSKSEAKAEKKAKAKSKPELEDKVVRATKPAKGKDKPAATKGKDAKPTKAKAKEDKPAKKTRRGERTGEYSAAVSTAMAKIESMKAGTAATTRELAEKYDLKPWAFLAAAHKLEGEFCKLKNANRVNTITRI